MELYFWLALIKVPGVGPVLRRRLLDHLGSPQAIFEAKEEELRAVEGISSRVVRAIKATDPLTVGERIYREAQGLGFRVFTLKDPQYPPNLREIFDSPPVLFIKGEILPQDSVAVAVVGSRRCSTYGRDFARRLSGSLAEVGVTIVSGMARGIDTEAHRGALGAGGRTLITASLALEQGRCVFAVPGLAGSWVSQGTHRLIREGAKLVERPEDILEEILPQLQAPVGKPQGGLSEQELRVLEALKEGPRHIDEITRILMKPVPETLNLLTRMELKGLLRQLPERLYTLQ
ncbi:MAG: hypothetical protein DRG31_04480 [Deltaproteobacteria bacterium]|nr:MAG: hypothetical protein DRG31_04480 [Deltaproteobacteria bacterium]